MISILLQWLLSLSPLVIGGEGTSVWRLDAGQEKKNEMETCVKVDSDPGC